MKQYIINNVDPMGAVRQTRRDRWKKRPVVQRYHTYRDIIRLERIVIPQDVHLVNLRFEIAMPKSWSKKKRQAMLYQDHRQKPDTDNLTKAFLDAVCSEDKHVSRILEEKVWAAKGRIICRIY